MCRFSISSTGLHSVRQATSLFTCVITFIFIFSPARVQADDGYRLWLGYDRIEDPVMLDHYRATITEIVFPGDSPTRNVARDELRRGLEHLMGTEVPLVGRATRGGTLIVATPSSSMLVADMDLAGAGDEGYVIRTARLEGRPTTVIGANSDVGLLYGVYHILRLLQTRQHLHALTITESPRIHHRVLNHWDNLDRTVERGYAGFSLWDWHKLPDYLDPRYTDYARANASIGINGTVLTNVNANATSLTPMYLKKAAALADVFRPYGIRVYLTARFSAPMEIGGLPTADPMHDGVREWWSSKADEVYEHIPDFGGFVVKANSEGQPGPHDYGRSHADGANMLADALAPHGGIVMWRAFVYSNEEPADRAKQAYNEFTPLDGSFRENVIIQVKNGPIDFQPREPFHPLFGAMPGTPVMMEFQITQEYLGQATHLVYLAPMWKEVLGADTYARGDGSLVVEVVDGSLHGYKNTGVAGVSNVGTDRNWCGSVMACANWYAFGRIAWDHALSSDQIADEWIRMTFSNDKAFVEPVAAMMSASHEAAVNYMTPLGLHHLMARGHHYGPGPWVSGGPRADWTSIYYHRADSFGIGFDRTETGSGAVDQYFPPLDETYGTLETVPEKYLLWFHHVPWDHTMPSGRTLWDELAGRYQQGVDTVRWMQETWRMVEGEIDEERYEQVSDFLAIQRKEAEWWRDSSLLYFQSFSGKPLPPGVEKPAHPLEHYMKIEHPYAPGI